jgi:hypothetical protein
MNKEDIKGIIKSLDPDKGRENTLSSKILNKQHNKICFRTKIYVVASLAFIICISAVVYNSIMRNSKATTKVVKSTEGIYIPKIELPNKTNVLANMIGLIVYQGKVYTQTGTEIDIENAGNILGTKIGTAKGNIDEWSKQQDYSVELASTTGKQAVYQVKGYDKNFRIMTYARVNGKVNAEFYDNFNGITIKTGEDVFGKLKIENNIKAAKYEEYESWNNGKKELKQLGNVSALNSFVTELKNTIPYKQESLSYLFQDNGDINQKFVYVTLKDGCKVQLRLFKEGYVDYGACNLFFKMNDNIFNTLWNELK